MTDANPPSKYEAAFYQSLGHMVVAWNRVEEAMRDLLARMCWHGSANENDFYKATIVTAELGNVALPTAIRTFASDLLPEHVGAAVLHGVEYFETLREYRNYYAHGVSRIDHAWGSTFGSVNTVSAKGKIAYVGGIIDIKLVDAVTDRALILHSYIMEICTRVYPIFGHGAEPIPLPDKPPLPDKLVKPRRLLRERKPQPPTSQT